MTGVQTCALPICLAAAGWKGHVLVAAVLHDTIEDTDTSYEQLLSNFGKTVADLVVEVSDDKSQTQKSRKKAQVEKAGSLSLLAKAIKVADQLENVEDVAYDPPVGWSDKKRLEYIAWADKVVRSAVLGSTRNGDDNDALLAMYADFIEIRDSAYAVIAAQHSIKEK